jgi:hypothetical protein
MKLDHDTQLATANLMDECTDEDGWDGADIVAAIADLLHDIGEALAYCPECGCSFAANQPTCPFYFNH